jgi:hypothetical protein
MDLLKNPVLVFLALIMLPSCATASFARLDNMTSQGEYAEGLARLEKEKR